MVERFEKHMGAQCRLREVQHFAGSRCMHEGEPTGEEDDPPSGQEFLTQELSEAELTKRIDALLDKEPNWNMKQILDSIGYMVDLEREAKAGL